MESASTLSGSHTIGTAELRATFLPAMGMLGASLRFRGVEMLRRIEDIEAAAAKGLTAGVPMLYPWANRLAAFRYRAAGREVVLDPASPMVHLDAKGLPMHGVPWAKLRWAVLDASVNRITAALDWDRAELLELFPFPHRLEMTASTGFGGLTIAMAVTANGGSPVPVTFGFHPYFGIEGIPRDQWRFAGPKMHRLLLDPAGIPTGATEAFGPFDGVLAGHALDDGFVLIDSGPSFSVAGAGKRITVEFLRGYRYAQIFAPSGKDFIAIEPMTAPTNALVSGRDLTIVPPGGRFEASFRIRVEGES